ncbi:MAG: hypothetical protein WEB29_08520 [Chloroflexota bacterium]
MPPEPAGQTSAGILISLDALVVQRADLPTAIEEAPVALRRIGWIGRPIILVGHQVAGRDLPVDVREREAWVRAAFGSGAYGVVPFEDPSTERGLGQEGEGVERWSEIRDAQHGTWLLTDRPRQVSAARKAGLKVILIGPPDPQPRGQRPDYQARDLRDAVGHLLTMDVFAGPTTTLGTQRAQQGT